MGRRLLAITLLVCCAAAARAEDGADDAAARAAGAAARAALPAPHPGISIAFHGDLVIQDLWAGELRLSAKLARAGREYVWRITEDSFLDWTGGEVHETLMVHAGQDLAVRSGTYQRTDRDGTVSLGFSRAEGGFDVERRVRKGDTWGKTERLTMKAAPKALGGLGSILLFLRSAKPAADVRYELPYAPSAAFKRVEDAEPTQVSLTAMGKATWKHGGKAAQGLETSRVRFAPGGTSWDLHLSRDFKQLVAMESTTGPVKIVPAGMGGERVTADPRAPATTWKQAFLKFGFGYHMARKALLAEAFHWPLFYEHEVKTLKRWDAERPLEQFREAWIGEFVAGSQHRDVPATRRLLSMTLATGRIEKQTADEVVFRAHPNFGGGTQRTYHFRKVDDRWGLWKIVSKP